MINKRRQVIIIVALVLLLVIIVAAIAFRGSSPTGTTGELRDKDTGELIIVGRTGYVEELLVPIFGEQNLYDNGVTKSQFSSIQKSLQQYMVDHIKTDFPSFTIRPQDYTTTETGFTSTIRLGQTDEIVPISVTLSAESAIVKIEDPNGSRAGTFVGISDLPYSNVLYSVSLVKGVEPLTLSVKASEGYRNAAVSKVKEFGFNPADFVFVFEDYKDPFSS